MIYITLPQEEYDELKRRADKYEAYVKDQLSFLQNEQKWIKMAMQLLDTSDIGKVWNQIIDLKRAQQSKVKWEKLMMELVGEDGLDSVREKIEEMKIEIINAAKHIEKWSWVSNDLYLPSAHARRQMIKELIEDHRKNCSSFISESDNLIFNKILEILLYTK